MHADEAILAFRLGTLLETGSWVYDTSEMHGPVLPYLSVVPARISGAHRFGDLTEAMLRIVPAFFGVLLVLTPLFLTPWLGKAEATTAGALTAISPAMVYYSRYYIPEMILTCLTAALLALMYRYKRSPGLGIAIGGGLLFGLMFATKETAIIALGGMILAGLFVSGRPKWSHTVASFSIALITISLVLGFRETLNAMQTYLGRGVSGERHIYPWHYYFDLLFQSRSDVLIVLLAVVGCYYAAKRDELRLLTIYTVVLTITYALIRYKTPWCLLSFFYGMILLAGVGLIGLTARLRTSIVAIAAVALSLVLTIQAWNLSQKQSSDLSNPYAYAQATRDVYAIRGSVAKVINAHPDLPDMSIQVISGENVWPLPWYLRSFGRVEWRRAVTDDMRPAPLILVSPEEENALAHRLYEVPPPGERPLYIDLFPKRTELRPGLELKGYVLQSLWVE